MDETREKHSRTRMNVVKAIALELARRAWLISFRFLDRLMDIVENDWSVVRREGNLFFGASLILLGLLNFQSNKYCDGNGASYLSCTQPTTYYYYGALEITLIIIGTFFVLLWFAKRGRA